MATIEINGQRVEVEPGKMIIEVADEHGIEIPRFCYHKKLSIAANCRMCLVDVEKSPKPLPACATPVGDGMKIFTQTPKALEAQKAVMEFLLINHPLDCPICDQGGECELQDVSMGYGQDFSIYGQSKRVVEDEDIGPLIATDMTRCIHCTRCVRFGEEIAGVRELGATGRGEATRIGTYIEKNLVSEISGNVIDICPVGALTSKPFRFQARAWEMSESDSIAGHDCIGSNIKIHQRRNEVMRVVPRENQDINETWLSDRDRFSYTALNHEQRLLKPMRHHSESWVECDWVDGLNEAKSLIQETIESHGANSVGVVVSPSATCEELLLLKQICQGLGIDNLDHRIRNSNLSTEIGTYKSALPSVIDESDCVVIIGSDVTHEQPIIGSRVRKASLNGVEVFSLNCYDYEWFMDKAGNFVVPYAEMPVLLGKLLQTIAPEINLPSQLKALVQKNKIDISNVANAIKKASSPVFIIGHVANAHPYYETLLSLTYYLNQIAKGSFIHLTDGANSLGANVIGMQPQEKDSLDIRRMFLEPRKLYILYGVEPECDFVNMEGVDAALKNAKVISMTSFFSDDMKSYADFMLPIAPFSENEGSYLNTMGQLQTFQPAVKCQGEVRPGWKVLRVLGNILGLEAFQFNEVREITEAFDKILSNFKFASDAILVDLEKTSEVIFNIQWPIYAIDPLVRRADPLQRTPCAPTASINMNTKMANQLGLKDIWHIENEGRKHQLSINVDESVADDTIIFWASSVETKGLQNLLMIKSKG